MAGIIARTHIAVAPETVFARASAFADAPRMISGIRRVEMLTEGPVGAGTRFRETRVMFGREATEEMEVTTFEPPHRYVLGCENCGCRYRSELRFRPSGSGTDVEMTFDAQPLTLFAKALSVLMRPMVKSMLKICTKDLEDLRASLEARG